MSRRRRKRGGENVNSSNIGCIWLAAIFLSMMAGYMGGQIAGIRPAFGNLHLLGPPCVGMAVGLFTFYLSWSFAYLFFGNKIYTWVLAIIISMFLAGLAGRAIALP